MKRIFICLSLLFCVSILSAYDAFGLYGVRIAEHVEVVTVENKTKTLLAPSIGFHMASSFFPENKKLGFDLSNTISAYITPNENYFSDRLLFGPAFKFSLNIIPMVAVCGLILQPEYEIGESFTSFHFLTGIGFDYMLGTNKNGAGFGAAINLGYYPYMYADYSVYDPKTKEKITKDVELDSFGRISFGITIGLATNVTPVKIVW